MGYASEKRSSWGCLPAGVFGFLFGTPLLLGATLGECFDEGSGRVTGCSNKGWVLLGIVAATAAICWLIMTGANRLIQHLEDRRTMPWWGWVLVIGIVGGCAAAIHLWINFPLI